MQDFKNKELPVRRSLHTPWYKKWWAILILVITIAGILTLNFLAYTKGKAKDSSHLIQAASEAIHENRNDEAIQILRSIESGDKSYHFAQEILYGLTEGREGTRPTSTVKEDIPLNKKIYTLNYSSAYKGGLEAAKEDREKNRSYEPELILAQPIFQSLIKMYSNKVVEKYGEAYRQDAEKGFRDGFMAGYKDGYK